MRSPNSQGSSCAHVTHRRGGAQRSSQPCRLGLYSSFTWMICGSVSGLGQPILIPEQLSSALLGPVTRKPHGDNFRSAGASVRCPLVQFSMAGYQANVKDQPHCAHRELARVRASETIHHWMACGRSGNTRFEYEAVVAHARAPETCPQTLQAVSIMLWFSRRGLGSGNGTITVHNANWKSGALANHW